MKRTIIKLFFALMAVLAILAGLFIYSKSETSQFFGTLVARVKTEQKLVALTFDDGPVPDKTEEILDILKKKQVKATFFLTGNERRIPYGVVEISPGFSPSYKIQVLNNIMAMLVPQKRSIYKYFIRIQPPASFLHCQNTVEYFRGKSFQILTEKSK